MPPCCPRSRRSAKLPHARSPATTSRACRPPDPTGRSRTPQPALLLNLQRRSTMKLFLQRLFGAELAPRRDRPARRPVLEALEDRLSPSALGTAGADDYTSSDATLVPAIQKLQPARRVELLQLF